MILGVGLDLCAVSRVEAILRRAHGARFEARVFSPAEREYCRGRAAPAQHYAARFAAKEAALKALGVPDGLSWHELEVVSEEGGKPGLRLTGAAAAAAGPVRVHLSLTHAGDFAAAVVILEKT